MPGSALVQPQPIMSTVRTQPQVLRDLEHELLAACTAKHPKASIGYGFYYSMRCSVGTAGSQANPALQPEATSSSDRRVSRWHAGVGDTSAAGPRRQTTGEIRSEPTLRGGREMVAENLETPRYTVSPSALYLHSEQHRQPLHSSRCRAGGCALSSQKQSRSCASALEIRSSGTPRPQVPTNVSSALRTLFNETADAIANPIDHLYFQYVGHRYIQCMHQRLYHLAVADYEDFVNVVLAARSAFHITPEGHVQFKEWLQSIRKYG